MDVQIECPCPRKADGEPRHASDTVTLRETLGFTAASAVRNTLSFAKANDPDAGAGEMLAILTEGYILHGIEAWTLVDEKGKPIEVSKPEIRARLLADPLAAEPIADAANELYAEAITRPLVARALSSLEPSPTDESTSPPETPPKTGTGSSSPRKRSKLSSTSTSPTDGIVTTTAWHGGASNSSPSSATGI